MQGMTSVEHDKEIIQRALNNLLSEFDYKTKALDQRYIRQLKDVIKINQNLIPHFVKRIFDEFKKKNVDRRLGAILVTDYFFQRAHRFRVEIVDHLQDLLIFTLEIDAVGHPLPGPPTAAKELKHETLKIVRAWIDKFGAGYVKLRSAFEFLTKSKNFDFALVDAQLHVERQREEELAFRQRVIAKKVADQIEAVFNENEVDIERTLNECRTAINLIFPVFFEDYSAGPSTEESRDCFGSSREEVERLHGYRRVTDVKVVINTDDIVLNETEDNEDLVTALNDAKVVLSKTAKSIKKWLKELSEVGVNENEGFVEKLIGLKNRICIELERCEKLKIKKVVAESDSSSDSESGSFLDVDEQGLESLQGAEYETSDEPVQTTDKLKTNWTVFAEKPGPSKLASCIATMEAEPVSTKTGDTLEKITNVPIVTYGLDLMYWGQDVKPAAVDRNLFDGHRFWKAYDPGNDVATERIDVYKSRQMTFVGKRPCISQACRFPMQNGKFCPRMDLKCCPFHGPIVARDEQGFPVNELGRTSLEALKNMDDRIQRKISQDERLYMRDVEAAVDIPLMVKDTKKRTRARQKVYGTARKRQKNDAQLARERLEKKLFDKAAMRRVANTLAEIQKKRAAKNFAHQFNYAVTNSR